jgi:hypothetical protein
VTDGYDAAMHRQRVERRKADSPNLQLPTWQSVLERQYDPWECPHIVVDTAKFSVEQAIEGIMQQLPAYPARETSRLAQRTPNEQVNERSADLHS